MIPTPTRTAFGLAILLALGGAVAYPVLAHEAHQPMQAGHDHGGHAHGDETAFGSPGDPARPARTVDVAMTEDNGRMAFVPNRIEVRKGEQVRFRLHNGGALDHEMVLATLEANLRHAEEMRKNPDMEHDDPNAKRVAPNGSAEILWRFDKAGEFDFSCLIPGHREAGMTGTIVVR